MNGHPALLLIAIQTNHSGYHLSILIKWSSVPPSKAPNAFNSLMCLDGEGIVIFVKYNPAFAWLKTSSTLFIECNRLQSYSSNYS